ncbi:MAG TPA: hypothetical protein VFL04_09075 [Rectinemataceae bacterium]|nr:hypothetical protein [Rectinemataceae bacterium]
MLTLGPGEREGLQASVAQMLDFFSIMDGLELGAIGTSQHCDPASEPQRADEVRDFNNRNPSNNPLSNTLVNNAPETSGRSVVIPNVL